MVPVPYRGEGPALIDLIGGQVQVMFAIMPSAIEYIRSRLRALAVTSATRVQPFPEIPAVGEFVPGYQATAFEGHAVGFGATDMIDLVDTPFVAGSMIKTYTPLADPLAGGTLTIDNQAGNTADIKFRGDYTAASFNISNDGKGGTLISDPPATAASGSLLLSQAIASFSAPSMGTSSALSTALNEQQAHPLLAPNPHHA